MRSSPPHSKGSPGRRPEWAALGRDTGGAVYVEFLIAFMPLFVFFSGLLQLGLIELADLVTQHAAVMATRAAVVVLPDNPAFYGGEAKNVATGQRLADIQLAATMTLNAVDASPQVHLTFPSSAGGTDSRSSFNVEDTVRVQIHYAYPCRIPVGNAVACGPALSRDLVAEAAMPIQGANYKYPGE